MRAQALKKYCAVPDEDSELTNLCSEAASSQRMFDCKGLPRLLNKEEMSCNAATD
ncbi:MAG: hypothetical protein IPJ01_09715 [Micavibrio sp.]|nr:hypothetical protein [Micavibrio sp.]